MRRCLGQTRPSERDHIPQSERGHSPLFLDSGRRYYTVSSAIYLFGTAAIAAGADIILRARKEAHMGKIPRVASGVVGATVLGMIAGTIHLAYEIRELDKSLADLRASRESHRASITTAQAHKPFGCMCQECRQYY